MSNVSIYKSDEGTLKPEGEVGQPKEEMKSCAERLISAVHSKDVDAVAQVLSELMSHE